LLTGDVAFDPHQDVKSCSVLVREAQEAILVDHFEVGDAGRVVRRRRVSAAELEGSRAPKDLTGGGIQRCSRAADESAFPARLGASMSIRSLGALLASCTEGSPAPGRASQPRASL